MTIAAEARFNSNVWKLLQNIKEYLLYFNPKDRKCLYVYSRGGWDDEKINDSLILERLQEWGAIEDLTWDDEYSVSFFTVNDNEFGEIYKYYKNLFEQNNFDKEVYIPRQYVRNVSFNPLSLPQDCKWKEGIFYCGDRCINFYNTRAGKTKTGRYFKLLTDSLGLPVHNEDVYQDFGYNSPQEVATGVKRDLARRLKDKKLLRDKNNPTGRISVTPISSEPDIKDKRAGYVCCIFPLNKK